MAVENLMAIMNQNTQQFVASAIVKKELELQVGNPVKLKQATGGAPLTVHVGPAPIQEALNDSQLSHEVFFDIQKRGDFSNNQILAIAKSFREKIGHLAVQPNLKRALVDEGESLAEFFEVRDMSLDVKNENDVYVKVQKPVVLCKNLPDFILRILKERGLEHVIVFKKYGMDGGGSFFKICLNVFKDESVSSPEKKKTASSSRSAAKFKDSGVKKLLLIAVVEGVPETYSNVQMILNALNIEFIDFSLASDLKLCNIACGMQGHSSSFPCMYCLSKRPFLEKGVLRTFGMLRQLAKAFKQSNGKDAKPYYSTVNEPLLKFSDEILVLDKIPPPELHIHLGVTNKFVDVISEKWGNDNMSNFLSRFNIQREPFRGKNLNGNNCVKFLQHVMDLEKALPGHLVQYAEALKHFDKVRKACFGNELDPNYRQLIKNFEGACTHLKIVKFSKLHILVDHVADFIERKQKPLGFYSEQASESVHADFQKTWDHYKRATSNPVYGNHLYRAVLRYNKKHL